MVLRTGQACRRHCSSGCSFRCYEPIHHGAKIIDYSECTEAIRLALLRSVCCAFDYPVSSIYDDNLTSPRLWSNLLWISRFPQLDGSDGAGQLRVGRQVASRHPPSSQHGRRATCKQAFQWENRIIKTTSLTYLMLESVCVGRCVCNRCV